MFALQGCALYAVRRQWLGVSYCSLLHHKPMLLQLGRQLSERKIYASLLPLTSLHCNRDTNWHVA